MNDECNSLCSWCFFKLAKYNIKYFHKNEKKKKKVHILSRNFLYEYMFMSFVTWSTFNKPTDQKSDICTWSLHQKNSCLSQIETEKIKVKIIRELYNKQGWQNL